MTEKKNVNTQNIERKRKKLEMKTCENKFESVKYLACGVFVHCS